MDKEYILKHKNYPVLSFKLSDDYELSEITEIYDEKRLPFGLKYIGLPVAQNIQFSDWIENRGLPRSRSDLANIEYELNVKNSVELSFGSYALNLTDHYWVHKSDSNLNWNNINFFENDFKEVIDFDFIGVNKNIKDTDISPDLTVDGNLRKKWIILNNDRFLLKGSRYNEMQEPFNEVIASDIMNLFGIDHVEYKLIRSKINNIPLSICKCMTDINNELITARVVIDTEAKENRNDYDRFIQICDNNGIKDVKEKLDDMMIIDFIIGNTDRHKNNFGILRDSDTLEWKKLAPIFDNGNSLFHSDPKIDIIEDNMNSLCKWLGGSNYSRLDYIGFPKWYSEDKFKDIGNIVGDVLYKNENINKDKKDKLVYIVNLRAKELIKILNQKRNNNFVQGISLDSENNRSVPR